MARMLVTCPESAHLESVDLLLTPLGILVRRCSAFPRGCPMSCPRTCAARLDRRQSTETRLIAIAPEDEVTSG